MRQEPSILIQPGIFDTPLSARANGDMPVDADSGAPNVLIFCMLSPAVRRCAPLCCSLPHA